MGCSQAESLAGALALREATQEDRDAYRRHLASCPRCTDGLGGDRDIERVAQTIAAARDEETWQPDVRAAMHARTRMARRAWRLSFGAVAALIVGGGTYAAVHASAYDRSPLGADGARAVAAVRNIPTGPLSAQRVESLSLLPPATAVFQVSVDRSGAPVKCTIAKSSGDAAVDRRLCDAALRRDYLRK